MIDRLIVSFLFLVIFLFPAGALAQPANNMGFMTLPGEQTEELDTPQFG
jgi:hypothetical protein